MSVALSEYRHSYMLMAACLIGNVYHELSFYIKWEIPAFILLYIQSTKKYGKD